MQESFRSASVVDGELSPRTKETWYVLMHRRIDGLTAYPRQLEIGTSPGPHIRQQPLIRMLKYVQVELERRGVRQRLWRECMSAVERTNMYIYKTARNRHLACVCAVLRSIPHPRPELL